MLVSFKNESAAYDGRTVLSGIKLCIAEGERIALVGESGAGKSTLLRMIFARCREHAALVPQDLALVQSLSVFHNVYIGRLHRHSVVRNLRNLVWPERAEVAAVGRVLAGLRLADKIFAAVGELSGGQQQRTAIGRALYHPGPVVIADEPVSNVDEHQGRDILALLVESKATSVLAMHDRALAIAYSSRLIGLKGGRIVFDVPSAGMKPSDLDELYRP